MGPGNKATTIFRHGRIFFAPALAALLAACGGGSGGGGGGDSGGNTQPPSQCSGSGSVAITGTATYERVPAVGVSGAKLDYDNITALPIRRAEIQAVCPDGSVTYDTTTTNESGAYALEVPENVDVVIRVLALMETTGGPTWDLRVVDNTRDQGVWMAEGAAFDSQTGSATVNLLAGSGWNGSRYAEDRAAGPFAIMDSIYTAMRKVLEAEPAATFPPLLVNWSPTNKTCNGEEPYPFGDGCIGTSFFADFGGSAGRNIFILGAENDDTDEYDDHIIVHEWGHYYEDAFARSDSIGGQHTGGSRLDLRVAFGEGWGNAWSGIATDDPLYVDTSGTGQALGFSFSVEDEDADGGNPGWWNEISVQEIIYDLYDGDGSGADDDGVALGFAPLHAVLTGEQKTTEAVTSIFPLIHFLKQDYDGDFATQTAIDAVVGEHGISSIEDAWGDPRSTLDDAPDGDSYGDGAEHVSPIRTPITMPTAAPVNICGTNAFRDMPGGNTFEYNRIGARRFLTFQVSTPGDYLVTLDGSGNNGMLGGDDPDGDGPETAAFADPDFFIALRGVPVTADFQQGVAASGVDNSAGDGDDVGAGIETATVALLAGETYVIEVVEYLNVDDIAATGGAHVCLDLSIVPQP